MIETEIQIIVNAIYRRDDLYKLMAYDASYFEYNDTRILYKIIRGLYEDDQAIDLSVIVAKLRLDGVELSESTFDKILKMSPSINFDFLMKSIEKREKKKLVMAAAEDLYKSARDGADYETFVGQLVDITSIQSNSKDFVEIAKLPDDIGEIFQKSTYIRTGVQHLDEKINGFFNGQLIVLAARPKKGKTSFAIQIMKNIRRGVLFFSLEMKAREIYSKMLSGDSNVESWRIEARKVDESESERIFKAHVKIKNEYDVKIYDSDINIEKIKSIIRRDYDRYKIVFIDYLQLIPGGKGDNQNLRISSITRDLKLLAHSLNISIVLLSQLNRDSQKENRRPELSDLRDSGAIEQDADIIIFLHENKEQQFEIIVGGNRKGRSGIIRGVQFVKEYSRFDDEIDVLNYEQN